MLKKETKSGIGNVLQPIVGAETEESRWLVGKSLLNGGKKLKPELQLLLESLGVKVSKVVTDHGSEPMICIKGSKVTLDALAAIAKGKVA